MPKGAHDPNHRKAGRSWGPYEAHDMMCAVFSGKILLSTVGEQTGRSRHAIETKIWKVLAKYRGEVEALRVPPSVERAGARWTGFEREKVTQAILYQGKEFGSVDYEWIAHCLRRTIDEVIPQPARSRGAGFGL